MSIHAAETPLKVCAAVDEMPYSNQKGEGFENKLAQFLGTALHRKVESVFWKDPRYFIRDYLDKDLCDVGGHIQFVFDFFWGNIFTLRKLEYVFLAVNDSENSLHSIHLPNVSSMNPTVNINSISCHFRLHIVTFETAIAPVAYFTSWCRQSILTHIFRSVIHIGDVN